MVSPKKWLQRFERSKKAQAPFKEDAERYKRSYMGSDYKKKGQLPLEDRMAVNFIYSMVETQMPAIFQGHANVMVRPKSPQYEQEADAQKQNLNYWARELGIDDELKATLFDWFFGWGAVEVGWEYKTKMVDAPPAEAAPAEPLDESGEAPDQQQQEVVVKDRPFVRWRNPFDIFLDVDVPRRKDGRFMIVRDVLTHEEFLGMAEIDEEIKEKVKPDMRPEDSGSDNEYGARNKEPDQTSDKEWVELLTIWDKESEQKILMTPSLPNEFLAVMPWPYDMIYQDDPYPVTILEGKKDFMSPYTFSEIRPLWGHIEERNRLRTAFLIHMKRNLPKYVYAKGAGTRAQLNKLMNARSDEATELNDPSKLTMAPTVQMPSELWQWDQTIRDDLENISSMTEYRGDNIAKTATEAQILDGKGMATKRSKSTIFENFVATIFGKLGMICQQFQDEQVTVEIEGPSGTSWKNISKHDIQGDFMHKVEPGIMEYKNEAIRKQQLLKYAEMMSNNPWTNQQGLAQALAEGFDQHPDKVLLSQLPPPLPPPPHIKIKPIPIENLPLLDQFAVAATAMQQNNVQLSAQTESPPQLPGNPGQQGPQVQMNMANMGAPQGGKVPLMPVQGNAQPNSGSTDSLLRG